jgi:DNA-binding MarR family transcriptional regulator
MAVTGGVLRLASLMYRDMDELLLGHELNRAEFHLLCTLRRNGVLNPGQISRETLSSGAAVTKRTDRLVRLGLVSRTASERDRRVVQLRLTDKGAALIDELLPRQMAAERAALAKLTPGEHSQLASLLSTVLQTVSGATG